jgi:uncharacterized protein
MGGRNALGAVKFPVDIRDCPVSRFEITMIPRLRLFLRAPVLTVLLMACALTAGADPLLTFPLKIKGHEIRAEIANTPESMRKGLMFRDRLAGDSGMIFIYPKPEIQAMWMKNTRIALSVAFADSDGRILNIEDMEPLSERAHSSSGAAAYALEMNRGWFSKRGIARGDRIEGLEHLPRQK